MSTVVKTRIIKIGNSQGIRIPKVLLEQTHLGEEVALELEQDHIIVRPFRPIRHQWEQAFQTMHEQEDDVLLDAELLVPSQWDEEVWEW